MLIITAPGQGAQTPGFLAPWLEVPGVAERLGAASELAGCDLIRYGTTAGADEIKDTAIAQPLLGGGHALLDTLTTYLEQGSSLEATARLLFVHPNTVRYRLRRVAELTEYTPSAGRDGFTLWVAVALGRLAASH